MKQSGRAVRACATRSGAQARQADIRIRYRCTIDVSTSSRGRGNPQPQILRFVRSNEFSSPKTTKPRLAVPSGVSWRDCSGDCHLVSPATDANLRLTQNDFQSARGCVAGIYEIPCADCQRRALPRAKSY